MAWKLVAQVNQFDAQLWPQPCTDRLTSCLQNCPPKVSVLCLDRAEISWEQVPPHTGKLFPYEEHSAIVILKLMLNGQHGV